MIEEYDKKETYCRTLGHCVHFKYCRTMHNKLPCSRILDCWFERLLIQEFIHKHYGKEELNRVFTTPRSKILTILDVLDKVQKNSA